MKLDRLTHLAAFYFPVLCLLGYYFQKPWLFLGLTVASLVLFQILDNVFGRDPRFPWKEVRAGIKQPDTHFASENIVLYIYIAVHIALLYVGVSQFAKTDDPLPWLLFTLPIALSGVNVLTAAHELMHGSTRYEAVLARVAAIPEFWVVHEYEHLYLHHRDEVICTEEDSSFAQINQSFYSYFFVGLAANFHHAWELQAKLLKAKGASFIWPRIILGTFLPSLVLAGLVLAFFGPWALLFFLLQAFLTIAVFLLGTYNQHYGLTRRKRADGRYESFTYMNIWSADFRLTNRMFWNLARHAHHHLDAFCSYTDLKIIDRSPLLPHGYFTMLAMSLLPPLWFKVMNPKVAEVLKRRDQLEAQGLL